MINEFPHELIPTYNFLIQMKTVASSRGSYQRSPAASVWTSSLSPSDYLASTSSVPSASVVS